MNYMKKPSSRITKQAVVGVDIRDTSMRYVVLVPAKAGGYIVGTWGEQAIAYDAVEDGEIIEFTPVASAARTLCEKTNVTRLGFAQLGNTHDAARWREVFAVGGFKEVVALEAAKALDTLTRTGDGSSVPVLYFTAPDEVVALYQGAEQGRYTYPLAVYAIGELREYIEDSFEDEVYRVTGETDIAIDEIVAELESCRIPAQAARIWRNVTDTRLHLPPMLYHEAFEYSQCIANALTVLVGEYDESHLPEVTGATFDSDHQAREEAATSQPNFDNTQAHPAGAFGRWFEKGRVGQQPAEESPIETTEDKTDTPAEAEQTQDDSDTNTPSNSS